MKRWGLRILSAFLTFTLGLCAAAIVRFRLSPVAKIQSVHDGTSIERKLPSTQVAEKTRPIEEVMQPRAVDISPYEIKRLIDEDKRAARRQRQNELALEQIWRRLGIAETGHDMFSGYTCSGLCYADISTLELDGRPGKETLLGIHVPVSWIYRYLIFTRDNSQRGAAPVWVLMGYVDAFLRYSDPEHRVMSAGPQRWLAIRSVSGYGSAFGSGAEDWYEVGERGVRQVLSYQTRLYIGLARPDIDRESKVSKIEYQDGIATAVIQTSTSYDGRPEEFGESFPLWTATRKVTFIKGPGMQGFNLDTQHSELPAEELDPYYGTDAVINNEDFLKYNYRELARLAARGNAKQKDWLRNYLKTCDETLEKQSLLTALGDLQP